MSNEPILGFHDEYRWLSNFWYATTVVNQEYAWHSVDACSG